MSKKNNASPAPKDEGVDPLTTGKTLYGEDVKGNSTLDDVTSEPAPAEDAQPTTDAQ